MILIRCNVWQRQLSSTCKYIFFSVFPLYNYIAYKHLKTASQNIMLASEFTTWLVKTFLIKLNKITALTCALTIDCMVNGYTIYEAIRRETENLNWRIYESSAYVQAVHCCDLESHCVFFYECDKTSHHHAQTGWLWAGHWTGMGPCRLRLWGDVTHWVWQGSETQQSAALLDIAALV